MLVLLRGQYEVVLAFAFANVSALTAFGSLPFGKATHASVVLRSMLGFLRTCVRLYADASKSARASGIYSVFYVPKIPTYQISQKYRAALPKSIFSALALHVGFAQGAVRSTAPHSQNTTDRVPKNVFEENFLGCTHRAFIPFFASPKFPPIKHLKDKELTLP